MVSYKSVFYFTLDLFTIKTSVIKINFCQSFLKLSGIESGNSIRFVPTVGTKCPYNKENVHFFIRVSSLS